MSCLLQTGLHIGLHVSFWIIFYLGISLKVEFLDLMVSLFCFLRNHHIIFFSGCINLHSHQQRGRVCFSPHAVCAVTFKIKCKVLMDSCKALHDSVVAHLSSLCLQPPPLWVIYFIHTGHLCISHFSWLSSVQSLCSCGSLCLDAFPIFFMAGCFLIAGLCTVVPLHKVLP